MADNQDRICITINEGSELYYAVKKYEEDTGKSIKRYALKSLVSKLRKDRLLPKGWVLNKKNDSVYVVKNGVPILVRENKES